MVVTTRSFLKTCDDSSPTSSRPRISNEPCVAREMPPWYADPNHGQFINDRRLSQKDIDTIVAWVDQGAKEGDGRPTTAEKVA